MDSDDEFLENDNIRSAYNFAIVLLENNSVITTSVKSIRNTIIQDTIKWLVLRLTQWYILSQKMPYMRYQSMTKVQRKSVDEYFVKMREIVDSVITELSTNITTISMIHREIRDIEQSMEISIELAREIWDRD
jgi:hypothetical protein